MFHFSVVLSLALCLKLTRKKSFSFLINEGFIVAMTFLEVDKTNIKTSALCDITFVYLAY